MILVVVEVQPRTMHIKWLAIIALAGITGGADAGDVPDDARRHASAGAKLFHDGRYEAALAQFATARALRPHPGHWWNIAVCLERLGRSQEAATAYETFARGAVDPSEAAAARERSRTLHEQAPAVPPIAILPPPAGTAAPASRWIAPIAVGGVGVGALAALTGIHVSIVDRADYLRNDAGCAPACDPAEVADLERRSIAVYSLAAVAGVAAVVDTVLWIRASRRAPAVRAWIAPVPGGAIAGGRF